MLNTLKKKLFIIAGSLAIGFGASLSVVNADSPPSWGDGSNLDKCLATCAGACHNVGSSEPGGADKYRCFEIMR
jgi:hypothetical protein